MVVQPVNSVSAIIPTSPVHSGANSGYPRVKEDVAQPQQQQEPEVSSDFIQAAAEAANQVARAFGTDIKFVIDEKTNIEIMKVIHAETGKVIREMPPKAVVEMIGKLWETIGVFIDAKA